MGFDYVRLHPDDIAAIGRAVADAMRKKPKVKAEPKPDELALAQEWYAIWADTLGYRRFEFTPSRQDYVLARIREGRTIAQWESICRWVVTDPHMRGENLQKRAYDDFETLAGSPSKFDKYLKVAQRGAGRASTNAPELFKGAASGEGRRL